MNKVLKKPKGIVFDFNGTLFLDNDINEITWRQFIKQQFGKEVSDEDFVRYFHGVNHRETLEHYAKRKLSQEEITALGDDGKEVIYRQYIKDHPERQVLTAGAEEFFKTLKKEKIPFTIATASRKKNVDFFFEVFGLDRYFDKNLVILDDGNIKSKPDPEIFLKAFEKIGVSPKDGLVFEDAMSGLKAARNAETGMIIAVDPEGKHHYETLDFVDEVIPDFCDLDIMSS